VNDNLEEGRESRFGARWDHCYKNRHFSVQKKVDQLAMKGLLREREARRLQSLRVSKNILKSKSYGTLMEVTAAPGPTSEESDAASVSSSATSTVTLSEELGDTTNQYFEKIQQLKKFNKEKKASAKAEALKAEWVKEQKHLESCAENVTEELCSSLEVMILHNPGDREMIDLLQVRDSMDDDVKRHKRELQEQVTEIRRLVKDSEKMKNKQQKQQQQQRSPNQTEEEEEEEEGKMGDGKDKENATMQQQRNDNNNDDSDFGNNDGQAKAQAVTAIVADVLLQLKTSTSQHWNALRCEEDSLSVSLVSARATIARMLAQDRHSVQNGDMASSLAEHEDDDCEVLMAIEEWYGKVASLDRSHADTCRVVDGEKKAVTLAYQQEQRKELRGKDAVVTVTVEGVDNEGETAAAAAAAGSSDDTKFWQEEETATASAAATTTTTTTSSSTAEGDTAATEAAIETEASPSGAWSTQDHMTFVKVSRRVGATGGARSALMRQWLAVLPHKTREHVLRHEQWHRACRTLAEKKKAATTAYVFCSLCSSLLPFLVYDLSLDLLLHVCIL
jgi:hypothetical protein